MNSASAVRILGIDPGSVRTGYGLIEERGSKLTLLECGAISTPSGKPLAERLLQLHDGLESLLARSCPDEVAVEGVFQAKNARSALVLGHARGVALVALARSGREVHEYAPTAIKQAVVGTGRADKEQVRKMVAVLLSTREAIRPLDASDGLAIAICHAHSRRLRALTAERGR